jgi:hypothetical protein
MAGDIRWCIGAIEGAELVADAEAVAKLPVGQAQNFTAPVFGAQHFFRPPGIVFVATGSWKQTDCFAPSPGAVDCATGMVNGSQIDLIDFQRFHELRQVKQFGRCRHLIRYDISVEWHEPFLCSSIFPIQYAEFYQITASFWAE